MENPKKSEWVTPKLVVKRRRKTTSARPEKIERTIDTGLEKENVHNPKFNPFQSKTKTARRQSTIGFGSIGMGINISCCSNSVRDRKRKISKILKIFLPRLFSSPETQESNGKNGF